MRSVETQPCVLENCKSACRRKAKHEDGQQDPCHHQHGSMIWRTTQNTRIFQNTAETIRMFVAHHWRQGRSTHGTETDLKEGTHCAEHFGPWPMVLLCEQLWNAEAQRQPGQTHWEDQCTQKITNGFWLTWRFCGLQMGEWLFPKMKCGLPESLLKKCQRKESGSSSILYSHSLPYFSHAGSNLLSRICLKIPLKKNWAFDPRKKNSFFLFISGLQCSWSRSYRCPEAGIGKC